MSVMRHWLAYDDTGRYAPSDEPRRIDTQAQASEYRELGWRVEGPFVPEADAGAVEATRLLDDAIAGYWQADDTQTLDAMKAARAALVGQ